MPAGPFLCPGACVTVSGRSWSAPGTLPSSWDRAAQPGSPGLGLALCPVPIAGTLTASDARPSLRRAQVDRQA